ncbi:polysaccharide biosynthesis PFTS motif protein [Methanococcoides sp. SA1]|nr:polysaccharide biosynthesis PFTS motif protein [Methanococcoides sp. SA1]
MNNINSKKIIVFETLSFKHLIAVLYYIRRNNDIRYFNINPRFEKSKIFKFVNSKKKINKFESNNFDLNMRYESHDFAFDNIDDVYNEEFENDKLISQMEKFIGSKIVHTVYKRELIERLQKQYDVLLRLILLDKQQNYEKINFVPSENFKYDRFSLEELSSNIATPFWASKLNIIFSSIQKISFLFALLSFPFLILILKTRKIKLRLDDTKKYQLGLRVYNNDWAFQHKYRRIDFLLDGKKLNKDNTLFCIETDISDEYMNEFIQNKYNVVEIRKILREVDIGFIIDQILKKMIPCCIQSTFSALRSRPSVILTSMGILLKYVEWSYFMKKYEINNYVVYNHFEKYHIARNIVLSKHNIKTWYYLHSIHYVDLFKTTKDDSTMLECDFTYLYYENLVLWGTKTIGPHKNIPNQINNFMTIGSLWSELVLMAEQRLKEYGDTDIPFEHLRTNCKYIIGLFDTTFGENAILTQDDMICFLNNIYRLLEENDEIGVVFKEKWIWEEIKAKGENISNAYKQLSSHERCYSIGGKGDTAEVIAISDIVISACFTSTTVEALGTGKKAIYFDASDRFRDTYYDKLPKMVAHGYKELNEYVNYWLNEVDDNLFKNYLNMYVIDEIDAYADGKAITRFRELLCMEDV